MFAQAMSSTNPTAATSTIKARPDVGDHLLLKRNQTHAAQGVQSPRERLAAEAAARAARPPHLRLLPSAAPRRA